MAAVCYQKKRLSRMCKKKLNEDRIGTLRNVTQFENIARVYEGRFWGWASTGYMFKIRNGNYEGSAEGVQALRNIFQGRGHGIRLPFRIKLFKDQQAIRLREKQEYKHLKVLASMSADISDLLDGHLPKCLFKTAVKNQRIVEVSKEQDVLLRGVPRCVLRMVELGFALYKRRYMFGPDQQMFIENTLAGNLGIKFEGELEVFLFSLAALSLNNLRLVCSQSDWIDASEHSIENRNCRLSIEITKTTCDWCQKKQTEGVQKYFGYCAGCSSKRYCSRKCQKKDWKVGKHHMMCQILYRRSHQTESSQL